jgi:hypothetical protein
MNISSIRISFRNFVIRCRTSINVLPGPSPSVYLPCESCLTSDPAVYYAHLAGNRARAHDPSRDRDDDSSGSGMMGTRGAVDVKVTPLRPIHANIANSMWWM